MTARIMVGDCRERLRELPAESVHCVVTSPPYHGLRDYKNAPLVWGGDADCAHDFDVRVIDKSKPGTSGSGLTNAGASQAASNRFVTEHGFCRRCGAWRGSLGLEPSIELYFDHIVEVFAEVKRVLRPDGTVWLNLGDCYASSPNGRSAAATKALGNDDRTFRDKPCGVPPGLKARDLAMLPARVALALQADGWWVRSDIIWSKPNPMPESITDRPTSAHEHVFLLTRSARYFYDAEAVRERVLESSVARCQQGFKGNDPVRDSHNNYGDGFQRGDGYQLTGRNMRNVWNIATEPYPNAHFATFPQKLVAPCLLAGTSAKGCCPKCGAPWGRIMAREFVGDRTKDRGLHVPDGINRRMAAGGGGHPRGDHKFIGWEVTCQCDAGGPVPATVLDPFGGSGTVGLVAERLGRDSILIEQNEDYCTMARARIAAALGRVEGDAGGPADGDPATEHGPLFAGAAGAAP